MSRVEEPFDVITMGRVGVDLYPTKAGVPLADVDVFNRYLGGSPTNVAVAAARFGRRTAVITKVGTEGFGDFVRSALRGFGVNDRFVGTSQDYLTPVVFCELYPPDHFPIVFYRRPTAPDMTIEESELDLDAIRSARVFWTTGTGLSAEPSRSSTLAALRSRTSGHTVHDLDYRPVFWKKDDDVTHWQRKALTSATVAIGNRAEVETAVGDGDVETQARRLLDLGIQLAFVKLGPDGTLVAWNGGFSRIPPTPVDVVNGLGAGDAFGGAVCHGLLSRWEPGKIAAFASAAGAYVAGQLACADAMPTIDQLNEFLAASGLDTYDSAPISQDMSR
jgi:5-dehydro-2-deoxygluconokinase